MNHYILIWSVCTFVESRVREVSAMEELVRQTVTSLLPHEQVERKYRITKVYRLSE